MQINNGALKLTATADEIRENLKSADIPSLLVTCAFLSQDYSLLRKEWRPKNEYGAFVSGMTPEVEEEVREECLNRLEEFRAAGGMVRCAPSYEEIHTVGEWMMGEELGGKLDAFLPLLHEEAVFDQQDLRRPR